MYHSAHAGELVYSQTRFRERSEAPSSSAPVDARLALPATPRGCCRSVASRLAAAAARSEPKSNSPAVSATQTCLGRDLSAARRMRRSASCPMRREALPATSLSSLRAGTLAPSMLRPKMSASAVSGKKAGLRFRLAACRMSRRLSSSCSCAELLPAQPGGGLRGESRYSLAPASSNSSLVCAGRHAQGSGGGRHGRWRHAMGGGCE